MSLYQMLKAAGPSGFGHGTTAEQVTEGLSLAGETMLVTGCNSGLGLETMRVLALRGARVVGTARTIEKAREACAAVTGETVPLACELSDPASVRQCVASVEAAGIRLNALICNAGIMGLPKLERLHGYESQFFTNHIGHFILVTGLLERMTETGRVVMLSIPRTPAEGGRHRVRQSGWRQGLRPVAFLWPIEVRQSAVRQGTGAPPDWHATNRQRRSPWRDPNQPHPA